MNYPLYPMDINRSRVPNKTKRGEHPHTIFCKRQRWSPKPFIFRRQGNGYVAGKMLTENKVALAKATGATRYAWGGYGEMNVQPTDSQNIFLFTFNNEETRERIWRDKPWSLSNTLTAIEKYNGRGNPKDILMEKLTMWVQIHGLHQNQQSEQNMVSVGNAVKIVGF
ncbi:unnamed protein product [Linum trigynum]|uniref:DUF4283 domain-containing protein n=1 Tax=Linum trigynum TaxID=586398 RepID=A0AAV2CDJ7_9ROSI